MKDIFAEHRLSNFNMPPKRRAAHSGQIVVMRYHMQVVQQTGSYSNPVDETNVFNNVLRMSDGSERRTVRNSLS